MSGHSEEQGPSSAPGGGSGDRQNQFRFGSLAQSHDNRGHDGGGVGQPGYGHSVGNVPQDFGASMSGQGGQQNQSMIGQGGQFSQSFGGSGGPSQRGSGSNDVRSGNWSGGGRGNYGRGGHENRGRGRYMSRGPGEYMSRGRSDFMNRGRGAVGQPVMAGGQARGGPGNAQVGMGGRENYASQPARKNMRMENGDKERSSSGSSLGLRDHSKSGLVATGSPDMGWEIWQLVTPVNEDDVVNRRVNLVGRVSDGTFVAVSDRGWRMVAQDKGSEKLVVNGVFESVHEIDRAFKVPKRGTVGASRDVNAEVNRAWLTLDLAGLDKRWGVFEWKAARWNMVNVPRTRAAMDFGDAFVGREAVSTIRQEANRMSMVAQYWKEDKTLEPNVQATVNVKTGLGMLSGEVKVDTVLVEENRDVLEQVSQVDVPGDVLEHMKEDTLVDSRLPVGVGLKDGREMTGGTQVAIEPSYVRTPGTSAGTAFGCPETRFIESPPCPVFVNEAGAKEWAEACTAWVDNHKDCQAGDDEKAYETTKTIIQQRMNMRTAASNMVPTVIAPTEVPWVQYVGNMMKHHPQNFARLIVDSGGARGLAVCYSMLKEAMVQAHLAGVMSCQHPLNKVPDTHMSSLHANALWWEMMHGMESLPESMKQKKVHIGVFKIEKGPSGRFDVVLDENTALTCEQEVRIVQGQLSSDEQLLRGRHADWVHDGLSSVPSCEAYMYGATLWDLWKQKGGFGERRFVRQSLHLMSMGQDLSIDEDMGVVTHMAWMMMKELAECALRGMPPMDEHGVRAPLLPSYLQRLPLFAVPDLPSPYMTCEKFKEAEHSVRGTCMSALFARQDRKYEYRGYLMLLVAQMDLFGSREQILDLWGRMQVLMSLLWKAIRKGKALPQEKRETVGRQVAERTIRNVCQAMVLKGEIAFTMVTQARLARYGVEHTPLQVMGANEAEVQEAAQSVVLPGYMKMEYEEMCKIVSDVGSPLDPPLDCNIHAQPEHPKPELVERMLRANTRMADRIFDVMEEVIEHSDDDVQEREQVERLLTKLLWLTDRKGYAYLDIICLDNMIQRFVGHGATFMKALKGEYEVELRMRTMAVAMSTRDDETKVFRHMSESMHLYDDAECRLTDERRAKEFLWAVLPRVKMVTSQKQPLSVPGALFAMMWGKNGLQVINAHFVHMWGQYFTAKHFKASWRAKRAIESGDFDMRYMLVPAEVKPLEGAEKEAYPCTLVGTRSAKGRRVASRMAKGSPVRAKEFHTVGSLDDDFGMGNLDATGACMASLCAGLANVVALSRSTSTGNRVMGTLVLMGDGFVKLFQEGLSQEERMQALKEVLVQVCRLHEIMRNSQVATDYAIGLRLTGGEGFAHKRVVNLAEMTEYVMAFVRGEVSIEYHTPHGKDQSKVNSQLVAEGRMKVDIRNIQKSDDIDEAWSDMNKVQYDCLKLLPDKVVVVCVKIDNELFCNPAMQYTQMTIASICEALRRFQWDVTVSDNGKKLSDLLAVLEPFKKRCQEKDFMVEVNKKPMCGDMTTLKSRVERRKDANICMDDFMWEAPVMGPLYAFIGQLCNRPMAYYLTVRHMVKEAESRRGDEACWTPAVVEAMACVKTVRTMYRLDKPVIYCVEQWEDDCTGAMLPAFLGEKGKKCINEDTFMKVVRCMKGDTFAMFMSEKEYKAWEKDGQEQAKVGDEVQQPGVAQGEKDAGKDTEEQEEEWERNVWEQLQDYEDELDECLAGKEGEESESMEDTQDGNGAANVDMVDDEKGTGGPGV